MTQLDIHSGRHGSKEARMLALTYALRNREPQKPEKGHGALVNLLTGSSNRSVTAFVLLSVISWQKPTYVSNYK